MSLIDMKMLGFDKVATRFYDMGAKIAAAREYALASTAKLIRNAVKDYGRKIMPKQSPFTSTIRKYKSGTMGKPGDINFQYQGAKMEAFTFAKSMIGRYGTVGAKDRMESFSGVRQKALRRAIKIENTGRAYRSKFDEKNDRYVKKAKPGKADAQAFRKLINFVQSRVFATAGRIVIGFYRDGADKETSSFAEDLVKKQAAGFTTTVTNKMRRFFFAIGFPFGGDSLVTPARPWIQPVFNSIKSQAIAHFGERFQGRMNKLLNNIGFAGDYGIGIEAA